MLFIELTGKHLGFCIRVLVGRVNVRERIGTDYEWIPIKTIADP